MNATALLVGAGGLGCGAALGLAAGGIRRLIVVDDDVVDDTNLPRQVLHAESAIGEPKVRSLARTLRRLFPGVEVAPVEGRMTAESAPGLMEAADVVLDGSDNLATKFLANDAAVLGRKALVHGAAVASWGQILAVPPGGHPCYRCLFEDLPPAGAGAAPSCVEAGVLGPVPGVIGALQAAQALRLLSGESPASEGRLIRYDSRLLAMRAVLFKPNPTCMVCGDKPSITSLDPARYRAEECRS